MRRRTFPNSAHPSPPPRRAPLHNRRRIDTTLSRLPTDADSHTPRTPTTPVCTSDPASRETAKTYHTPLNWSHPNHTPRAQTIPTESTPLLTDTRRMHTRTRRARRQPLPARANPASRETVKTYHIPPKRGPSQPHAARPHNTQRAATTPDRRPTDAYSHTCLLYTSPSPRD